MKPIILVIVTLTLGIAGYSQSLQPNDSIKEFVGFLSRGNLLSPKEYVFKSFETKDIIVLSERLHPEFKQYELIVDILKDKRFKGNVYTEVGVHNSGKKINEFLKKEGLSKDEKEMELLEIFRNLDYVPLWPNYNYFFLVSSIYDINQERDQEDKIFLFPLDVEFSWDSIECSKQYTAFLDMMESGVVDRNLLMGKHFVNDYMGSKYRHPDKKKALVILNTYHGYTRIPTYLPVPTEPLIYSTAEYIYKTFPDITMGILINGYSFSTISRFVAGGKWDAAFKMNGNKNVGFDMRTTPFGATKFDMYNFGGKDFATVKFEYVFDGFIFYCPVEDFELAVGIPGIFNDKEFIEEFYRRSAFNEIISPEKAKDSKEINEEIENLNILRINKVPVINELNREISKWQAK